MKNGFILPLKVLQQGKASVNKKPMEVCGSFDLVNGILHPKDEFQGFMEDGRYVCERNPWTVTDITYHTHVYDSPGYPSPEDLLTLVEEKKTIDIIYTCWGVWLVRLQTPGKKVNKQQIHKFLSYQYSPFNNGVDRIKQCNARVKKAINEFITEMAQNNYKIRFIPWSEIQNIKILNYRNG